jgi:hypothetical protein
MKKYTFYFLNIFLLFSIYCQSDDKNENIDLTKNVYLDINFDKNIRINSKIIINDLTTDIPKYLKNKDTTDDLLKSNKYIYRSQDLNHYKDIEETFSNDIKENLENIINDKKTNIILNEPENEGINGLFININIFDYTEGEYNLISNRKTNIKFLVKINKKDSKTDLFLLQLYNYSCNSDIINPIEELRLNIISKKFIKDLFNKLKNYKIINNK